MPPPHAPADIAESRAATSPELDPPIVAAVDGSATSYHAAVWAAVDAKLRGCPLQIITSVAAPGAFGPGPAGQRLRAEGERVLTAALRVTRTAVAGETVTVGTRMVDRPIVPELIERSSHSRILVVGNRGLGAYRRELLGSVSSAVIRYAHCPVAVVSSAVATDPDSAHKPVLVGVDGTDNSMPAIRVAFEEASWRGVGVVALHAWDDTDETHSPAKGGSAARQQEEELLAECLAGFGERYPDVSVRQILVRDRPARSLLAAAEDTQLIVTGSHGRDSFTGMLLGSTSAALLPLVKCP
uniref:universal stress protein n=1 Tax=Nocardia paucivorans TaxID=114259 RepID=UPI000A00E8B8